MFSAPTPALIIAALVTVLVLFLIQPLVLRASCALCGEKGPRYLRGLGMIVAASIVGSVASALYGVTLGIVFSAFSSFLAGVGAIAVSWMATSVVYSAFLRVSIFRGAGVAVVHHLLGIGITALVVLGFKLVLAMAVL